MGSALFYTVPKIPWTPNFHRLYGKSLTLPFLDTNVFPAILTKGNYFWDLLYATLNSRANSSFLRVNLTENGGNNENSIAQKKVLTNHSEFT